MALAIFNTGCLSPQTSGSTGSAESGGGRSIASINPSPSPTPFPTPTPSGTVTNPSPIGSDSEIGSLGFNGEGMPQNYALLNSAQKDQLAQWLKDLGRPVTFRIPGGGSSRFHHPNVATPGWGNRKQEIVWYFDCFAPSDDSAANKSSELLGVDSTDSVAPQSYLNEIVDLSERMDGNLRIIYVANVMIYPSNLASIGTSTSIANCGSYALPARGSVAYNNLVNARVNDALTALKYLVEQGVQVVGVEAGNEVYGALDWNFDEYKARYEPIFTAIKADPELETLKRSIVSGNKSSSSCKTLAATEGCWNSSIKSYNTANFEAVSIHPYINEEDLGTSVVTAFGSMIERVSNFGVFQSDLANSFKDAYTQLMTAGIDENNSMIDAAKSLYTPEKEVWITEWNTKHVGESTPTTNVSFTLNTLTNGAWQFDQMLTQRLKVGFMLMHNGVSNALFGAITVQQNARCDLDQALPWSSTKSLVTGQRDNALIRRVGYWATKLAADYLAPISGGEPAAVKVNNGDTINLTTLGIQRFYFTNLTTNTYNSVAFTPTTTISATLKIKSKKVRYIAGQYLYSSAGWAGFMDCNDLSQNGSYELGGIIEQTNSTTVPANSFGYIEYNVSSKTAGTGVGGS